MYRTVTATQAELRMDLQQHFDSCYKAFLSVDVDRSGRIEVAEIERILTIYNLPVSNAAGVLKRADKDGDGLLNYDEFTREFFGCDPLPPTAAKLMSAPAPVPAPTNPHITHQANDPALRPVPVNGNGAKELGFRLRQHHASARKAFLKLDRDRSGFVSEQELRRIERDYNMPMGDVLSSCDRNGDGRLSFNEVARFLFDGVPA